MAGRVTFAIPGDLEALTGGYGYDRRIVAELRRLGWHVDVLMLQIDRTAGSVDGRAVLIEVR